MTCELVVQCRASYVVVFDCRAFINSLAWFKIWKNALINAGEGSHFSFGLRL